MCDTFVALPSVTRDGSVIFGKNSDREPNEAQVLEYLPACCYSNSDQTDTSCTYIQVPQVKETYAILISRPFWMWGAEMGANEKGVVIGNEAVFTRMPYSKDDGLTGMDMLRLALERSATAQQALETIVQLLTDFGQGGICGYRDKKMVYHNSFLVADPQAVWVLETAGHLWAALEIQEAYSISNGLTIGEAFDRCHPELINTARDKGWLKKGKTFHFAKCYSDWLYTTFSAGGKRKRRSFDLIDSMRGKLNVQHGLDILRDHNHTSYRPDSHLLMGTVCMHAANGLTRNANTTGSLVAHLNQDANTFWATGTAAPCTGIFKPVRFGNRGLPEMGPLPGENFDPATLWWQHEALHRSILTDYPTRLKRFKKQREELEASFLKKAETRKPEDFFELTREAFQKSSELTDYWIKKFQNDPMETIPNRRYRRYWQKQNNEANMDMVL